MLPGAEPFEFDAVEDLGVFLIHGFTASCSEVRPIGIYLNDHEISSKAVLLAGHGTSPQDLVHTTRFDWYTSAHKEIQKYWAKGFQKRIICGISMGALLAIKLAMEVPVDGIILLSIPWDLPIRRILKLFLPLIAKFKPFIDKGEEASDYFKANNLTSYQQRPVKGISELLTLIKEIRPSVSRLNVPILAAFGALDKTNGRTNAEDFKHAMEFHKELSMLLLQNSKHILTVEPDRDYLFAQILKFCQKIRSRA